MLKTIVYRKGTEKEPLRILNKKINLSLFALESLFFWCQLNFSLKPYHQVAYWKKETEMFIYQQRITSHSLPRMVSVFFTSAEMANTSPNPGQWYCPEEEAPAAVCKPHLYLGHPEGCVKRFSAKGEMAWNCICHILFFMNIEISFLFLFPHPGW